ncbi:MAG: hypothetical protein LUQ20_08180 [Candidatus Methanoperedens sp.]|jgi:hypothetical protein|nr:hypothetical protein [Candidatus Methanoperedens sp.]
MNRGYLGDVRDLFKFDLIKEIILGIDIIERFTYIPMLTNDDDKHGNIRNSILKKQFFSQIKEKLKANIIASPIYIFGGDVAFFFLSKNRTFKEDLHGILKEYTMKYPDLEVI